MQYSKIMFSDKILKNAYVSDVNIKFTKTFSSWRTISDECSSPGEG